MQVEAFPPDQQSAAQPMQQEASQPDQQLPAQISEPDAPIAMPNMILAQPNPLQKSKTASKQYAFQMK